MLIPLDICYDSALISVRYLEPRYLELFAISNRFLDPLTKLTIKTNLAISNCLEVGKINASVCVPQPKNLHKNLCYFKMVSWMLKQLIPLVSMDFKLKNKQKYFQIFFYYDAFMK